MRESLAAKSTVGRIAAVGTETHAGFALGELDGQVAPDAYDKADLLAFALEAGIPSSTCSFLPGPHTFALMLVERCASSGDKYGDAGSDANAGEGICAAFGLN